MTRLRAVPCLAMLLVTACRSWSPPDAVALTALPARSTVRGETPAGERVQGLFVVQRGDTVVLRRGALTHEVVGGTRWQLRRTDIGRSLLAVAAVPVTFVAAFVLEGSGTGK